MSECGTCLVKIKPYQDRTPCNGVYHLQQCLDPTCKRESKYGRKKMFFCQECYYSKNFQCAFCRDNFFTAQEAEQHMYNNHFINMNNESIANFATLKCELCKLKTKFFTEREKNPFLSTTKFISMELNMRQLSEEFSRTQLETNEAGTEEEESVTQTFNLADLTEFPPP